jgi:hypothetical protein
MVSFALIASSRVSSSIQNGMPTKMELLHKGKAWELQNCSRQRRLKGADGSTKEKSQQRKLSGQEDWQRSMVVYLNQVLYSSLTSTWT